MSILSRLQEKRGERIPDPFAPKYIVEVKQTDEYKSDGLCLISQYKLIATVQINFWANQSQYKMARENAEKLMAETMFKNIIISARKAMSAAYAGDRNGVMQACADILLECEL